MRKRYQLLLIITCLSFTISHAQDIYGTVNSGIGINVLNVEKSEGGPLNDWNTFSWTANVEGLVLLPSGYLLGAEVNVHRLYSYSRFYAPGNYYINGNIWTYHVGLIGGIALTDNFYVKVGGNLRIYSDGSGVAPGFMAGFDYVLPLSGNFSLPVGFRSDLILGHAITASFNAMVGLRYYIEY